MSEVARCKTQVKSKALTPRLGFVGAGWIGRHRMEAIARSGFAEIVGIAEPVTEFAGLAGEIAPGAILMNSFEELLNADLDGVVIATPSALHAEQSILALERGIAVFCQKPLARTAAETKRVVDAARVSDRLLGVDLSYRAISSMKLIKDLVQGQEFGEIFAVDLIFHNAHGPDKAWFYDPQLSGGGCIIDLGIHLIDLVLWTLDYPRVRNVSSRLFAKGRGYRRGTGTFVEDYAVAILDLEPATVAHLTCSWKLHAGFDAVIQVSFYGTKGGASLRNVNGSFYDFTAERFLGSCRTPMYPQDCNDTGWDWGGYAATDWTRRLARGEGFDRSAEHLVEVAATIDAIYSRS